MIVDSASSASASGSASAGSSGAASSAAHGLTLVWLRDDLRVADNPALHDAVQRGGPVIVFYLFDEESPGFRALGGASKWWLHHSLEALDGELRALGSSLVLRRGPAATEVPRLVEESGATGIRWNRRYGGPARTTDAALKSSLREAGVDVVSYQANLLWEPWTLVTGQGNPFRVFTPFWKAGLATAEPREPFPAPTAIPDGTGAAGAGGETRAGAAVSAVASDSLADWALLPTALDWAGGLRDAWVPGEQAAHEQLDDFLEATVVDYHEARDLPGVDGTSRLSPRLRFGELSPFQIWHEANRRAGTPEKRTATMAFLREVGWREFNWNILYHFPDLASRNFRSEFDAFPWEKPDPAHLEAWYRGRTGIPLVDAGMRELWHTGVMHNRVRMVTASFLIKNLLIDWRIGERWFWDTLVDADEANNPANWQWVAGSGADAAPYFRVFNPVLQAEKFDRDAAYRQKWIPELGTADYPEQIVDLKQSRQDALDAYEAVKRR